MRPALLRVPATLPAQRGANLALAARSLSSASSAPKPAQAAAAPIPPPAAAPPPPPPPAPRRPAFVSAAITVEPAHSVLMRKALKMDDAKPDMGTAFLARLPEAQQNRKVRIFQFGPNAMQSGTIGYKPWRIEFTKGGRGVNPLMGWTSGYDPMNASGLRMQRFDTQEQAENFAKKMGWKYEVEPVPAKKNWEGLKAYDRNFLNVHVKKKIETLPAGYVTRTQFKHPELGTPTWANLGALAVEMKTSTRPTEKVEAVSQAYWNLDKEVDPQPDSSSWRTDGYDKTVELRRKLGK